MKHINLAILLTLSMALGVLAATPSEAAQNLYRWTDERGNQVNSDRPPTSGVDYEIISTQSSMVRQVDAAKEDTEAKPSPDQPNPNEETATQNTAQENTERDAEMCQRARNNLAQLDTSARIRLRNEEGEIRYLNEEEKALQRQKALDAITAYCP